MNVPFVIEQDGKERAYDIFSYSFKYRIVFLGTEINSQVANVIVSQLLVLDREDSSQDISLYINSPGGSVSDGLAIVDTMNIIKSGIKTVCYGQASSMGAVILACGDKGKRFALPNARIMIHQPSGGFRGQDSDVQIQAKELARYKKVLNEILAERTGQSIKKISKDTDRDFFMTSEESKKYGIIDSILEKSEDRGDSSVDKG